jgi:hypothetical protein
VVTYLRAHPPAGSIVFIGGGNTGLPNPRSLVDLLFLWPAIPSMVSKRSLTVRLVQLPDGSTGLRADARAEPMVARPASERIPANARLLRVTATTTTMQDGKLISTKHSRLTTTASRRIREVAAALNALPALQPFFCAGCGGIPIGIERHLDDVRLAFFAGRLAAPVAIADIQFAGYGASQVRVTIKGRAWPPLDLGQPLIPGERPAPSLIQQLDSALGVKLEPKYN